MFTLRCLWLHTSYTLYQIKESNLHRACAYGECLIFDGFLVNYEIKWKIEDNDFVQNYKTKIILFNFFFKHVKNQKFSHKYDVNATFNFDKMWSWYGVGDKSLIRWIYMVSNKDLLYIAFRNFLGRDVVA